MQTYTSLSTPEEKIVRQSSDFLTKQREHLKSTVGDIDDMVGEDVDDAEDGQTQLASWLLTAPSDIMRMCVEKRFIEAVSLVMRCRAYVSSVLEVTRGAEGALNPVGHRAQSALRAVEDTVNHLADGILKSLAKLPNSPVCHKISNDPISIELIIYLLCC